MVDPTLAQEVYQLLKQANRKVKKDLRNKIKESGFTWTQFHALYHIEEGGLPVNELARELHCNASNMTGLIDRMSEHGLVYREHSREDRRVWLVKLTDEGNGLKKRLYPQHLKNIDERMGLLDNEELITLQSLLSKLIDGEMKED